MSAAGTATAACGRFSLRQLQHVALWLFVASSWLVVVEPSPYEMLFVLALLAFLREYWAPMYRAQGTFKDPNVFSTFLIPPLCFLLQAFMLGTQRRKFWSAVALCLIGAGLFFAFSRGAWVNAVVTIVLLAVISFITHATPQIRTRIILLAAAFVIAATAFVAFALSFDSIRAIFHERANLINYYDAGETGRFGDQLNSLPLLLGLPNGMGPMQFRKIFGNDPHNVFINAFAANGWLGGISFLLLVLTTIAMGWKTILTATPLRHQAIAVFCPLLATLLQGVQIDIEHWRHLLLMMGLTRGLHAAATVHAHDRS